MPCVALYEWMNIIYVKHDTILVIIQRMKDWMNENQSSTDAISWTGIVPASYCIYLYHGLHLYGKIHTKCCKYSKVQPTFWANHSILCKKEENFKIDFYCVWIKVCSQSFLSFNFKIQNFPLLLVSSGVFRFKLRVQ